MHRRPERLPLCCLATTKHYQDPDWRSLHEELRTYSVDTHVFQPNVYRKGWEWTHAVYGLRELGALRSDATGLGVGAGRECIIFYLSNLVQSVIATDLYGNETWAAGEADAAILDNPADYCRREFRRDRLRFEIMDGTALRFPANTFDFCWSLSSIEHFGGHERSAVAVREMIRVLKPGGIAAIATEYLLMEEYSHPEYFNRQQLLEYVANASSEAAVAEEIDFSLPPVDLLVDQIVFPHRADRLRRHMVLNDGNVQWTSVMLFLRKI